MERARALRWEPGVRLRLDEARGLPFTLELRGVTPERARRSAAALAAFLASIPTPPRVRLRFVDCPPSPAPRHKQVAGQLRAHFAPEEVQLSLTREPDGRTELVELRFARPDPRWPEWTGQA